MKSKQKLSSSLVVAIRGVVEASLQERNLKVQWSIGLLVVIAGAVLQVAMWEWALIVVCIAAVLAAEMMNTALESLVNLLQPEVHDSARKAKDFAAGGVLMMSLSAAVVGLMIFGRRLLDVILN